MTQKNRREFLGTLAKVAGATTLGSAFPPVIERALAVPASRRTGSLRDVEHIVILTQENRSFDHYFGSLGGVRGFADPFPIPRPDSAGIMNKNIWYQPNGTQLGMPPAITPFHLDTAQNFKYIRVEGTHHSWTDAQHAWNHGKMDAWPKAKKNHSMGYFTKDDIPFQWALANAFSLCDAYHCAIQAGTNPNRLFIWTGTNDGLALGNGPGMYNDYDWFEADPGEKGGYAWVTYAERLEQAGISWQVYENMDDNFTDNPMAGFRVFRDAWFQRPGFSQALRSRGVSTRDLDALEQDVRANRLPQVSWIVSTAEGSEHPDPSSPAQGAAYTARVLEALTANPEVWSKTVLLINFDENDGFFDHVPPPAPPSYVTWNAAPAQALLAGASTVDTRGEYHEHLLSYHNTAEEQALQHRPYGLGARVPLYVVSPWSKGGWVNSQTFDHTSVIRFIEARFGVHEPNISAWRRAVCGDLTSAFDFSNPNNNAYTLPDTLERAERARALTARTTPPTPASITLPSQERGIRPSRALPYELHVTSLVNHDAQVELAFANSGAAAAVFHAYDRLLLGAIPRRYTVEGGKSLVGVWTPGADGAYDLWIIGPNGFHRHFMGNAARVTSPERSHPEVRVAYDLTTGGLSIVLSNSGGEPVAFSIVANRYYEPTPTFYTLPAHSSETIAQPLPNGPWYDFSVAVEGDGSFHRRFAGRMETGADSTSDPAMEGVAVAEQYHRGESFPYQGADQS